MGSMQTIIDGFAVFAVILCAFLSANAAREFGPRAPPGSRLFSILALFSLAWAMLLPYYAEGASESITAFSGFVFTYVGLLLIREVEPASMPDPNAVNAVHEWSTFLLMLVLVPSGLVFVATKTVVPSIANPLSALVPLYVGTLLSILGYVTILTGLALKGIENRQAYSVFLYLSVAYGCLELGYCITQSLEVRASMRTGSPIPRDIFGPMDGATRLGFAMLKIIYAALFIALVTGPNPASELIRSHGPELAKPLEERPASAWSRLRRCLKLPPIRALFRNPLPNPPRPWRRDRVMFSALIVVAFFVTLLVSMLTGLPNAPWL
jgi:hypothetical protein